MEPKLGQWGLRILGVTGRPGVPECGRTPRHQSRIAGCIKDPRSRLSIRGCHKLQTVAWLGDCSLSRSPTSGRTSKNPPSHWKEWRRSTPQETAGFGDSKRGHVTEIETLGPRLGEHGVWLGTRERGVINCFSLRAH